MTLKELIQRAVDIANQGLSEASHTEQAAEAHLPAVFHAVGVQAASSFRLRTTLRRTKTLTPVIGVVTLTSDVLTAYIDEAILYDPADITKRYSLISWELMLAGQLDQRLGAFALQGESTLHIVEPFTIYDPISGPGQSLLLTTPCTPAIPTGLTNDVLVIDEVAQQLITALAAALRLAGA